MCLHRTAGYGPQKPRKLPMILLAHSPSPLFPKGSGRELEANLFFLLPSTPSISSLWVGEGKDDAGAGDQLSSFEQREVLEFCPPDGSQRRQVHSFARHFPVGRLVILAGSDSGMESDEEIRRVPEFGFEQAGPSTSGQEAGSATGADRAQSTAQAGQRRRGRSPADKEHKRLKRFGGLTPFVPFAVWCVCVCCATKRLLRNRVSAQQARERKKLYLTDLEAKVKDLETKNSELEERISTLQKENNMLRQVGDARLHVVPRSSSAMPVPDDVVRGVRLVLVIIQLGYQLRQVDCDRDFTKSTEDVVRGSDT
ncbi:hypothetical protein BHM03_00016491 [Ensete ventricosum]|nr:hypothetical protein BHM03_00016491 [Ensete ventricosum]